jgi:PST family polysaccharide transporter
MVNYAFLNLDYVVIGRLEGAVALGTYLLAFNVSSWPYSILGSSINNVSMPAFSDAGQAGGLQRRLEITLQTVALIAFPISAMLTVLAAPLVATLYGDKWSDAASVLALLAPYGAAFLLTLVIGNALVGRGRSGTILLLQVLWLATLLPLLVVLVRSHGARGAAAAHLASIALAMGPIYLVVAKRLLGVELRGALSAVAGPLAFSLAAAAAAMLVRVFVPWPVVQLLVGGSVGGVVYGVLAAPALLSRLDRRLPLVSSLLSRPAQFLDEAARRCGLDFLYSTEAERSRPVSTIPALETVR